ncbi:MAG: class 1 isoprenoid biosynthesis enzyme [Bacillota bacterium]
MEFFNRFNDDLKWVFKSCKDIISNYPEGLKKRGLDYLAKYNVFNEDAGKNYICYLLPFWVNYNCDIDKDTCRKISLANTFMMLFAFIQDDVMDGELDSSDVANMLSLGNLFFTDFIEAYREIFGSDMKFWEYFRECMMKWTKMVAYEKRGYKAGCDLLNDEIISLASGKAGLVKLAAAAVCILSGKEEMLSSFCMAVDRVLYSLQIADDYVDWKDDLKGRSTNLLLYEAMKAVGIDDISSLKETHVKRELIFGGILNRFAQVLYKNSNKLEKIPLGDNPYFKGFNLHLLSFIEAEARKYNERKRAAELGGFFYWIEKNTVNS